MRPTLFLFLLSPFSGMANDLQVPLDRIESQTCTMRIDGLGQIEWEWHQTAIIESKAGYALLEPQILNSASRPLLELKADYWVGDKKNPSGPVSIVKESINPDTDTTYGSRQRILVPRPTFPLRLAWSCKRSIPSGIHMPRLAIGNVFPTQELCFIFEIHPSLIFDFSITNKINNNIEISESFNDLGYRVIQLKAENIPGMTASQVRPVVWSRVRSAESASGWGDVAAYIAGLHPDLAPASAWNDLIRQMNLPDDRTERIKALFLWVRDNIRYTTIGLGDHDYRAFPPDQVLSQRFGDCKDMAYFMQQLLKAQGIEAMLTLVGTDKSIPLEKVPATLAAFDHMIVSVPQESGFLFLDPTAKETHFGALPLADQGAPCLILTGGQPIDMRLPTKDPFDMRILVEKTDLIDGHVQWQVSILLEGEARADCARALKTTRKSQEEALKQWLEPFLAPRYLVRPNLTWKSIHMRQEVENLHLIAVLIEPLFKLGGTAEFDPSPPMDPFALLAPLIREPGAIENRVPFRLSLTFPLVQDWLPPRMISLGLPGDGIKSGRVNDQTWRIEVQAFAPVLEPGPEARAYIQQLRNQLRTGFPARKGGPQ